MLEVKGFGITFHDRGVRETAIEDYHMHIQQGEKIGVVGESGSGKTMLAWSIAGITKHDKMDRTGVILFEGADLLTCSKDELRAIQGKEIGIIFQEPMNSLNPVLRIGRQIEESLLLHTTLTPSERYEKVIEVMRAVELKNPEQLYDAYPHELSGGMRQRVMIAAAIVTNPKLLIADEPTTALDVTVQDQIIKLLEKINRDYNTSILFISHDLSVVRRLCDELVVMKSGEIVEQGKTSQIFDSPKHSYTKELIQAIPRCERVARRITSSPILEVKEIEVAYADKGEAACKEVSFQVRRGEIVGILGESGSGKSSVAKAITKIVPIRSGDIVRTSETIQMIFQDPKMSLNPARKVGWILEEPLKIKGGYSKMARYEKVVAILHKVGLDEKYYDSYPNQLSGGQRQRVAIALALILEPDFIIADEPVSALDVTIQAQVIALLLALQKELELSMILISHDLRIVYQMCDTVVVMKEGRIVEQGSIAEVYHNPKTDYMKQLLKAQFD